VLITAVKKTLKSGSYRPEKSRVLKMVIYFSGRSWQSSLYFCCDCYCYYCYCYYY